MRSNFCRSSATSIYMLSVTDFDPKGTISEVRVHAGAKFGHTGCWSIAKCRFCTKFSKSFDHHAETKKIVSKIEKKTEHYRTSVRKNWGVRYRVRMRGWLCERCKREVGKDSMMECSPGHAPKLQVVNTRTYCVYRFILLVRWGDAKQDPPVAAKPCRPPKANVGTKPAFRHDQCKHFQKGKHLLRSEVSLCDQTRIDLHLRRST